MPLPMCRRVSAAILHCGVFSIKSSPNNQLCAVPDSTVVRACSGRAVGRKRVPSVRRRRVTAAGLKHAVCINAAPDDERFACPDSCMEPSRAGRAGCHRLPCALRLPDEWQCAQQKTEQSQPIDAFSKHAVELISSRNHPVSSNVRWAFLHDGDDITAERLSVYVFGFHSRLWLLPMIEHNVISRHRTF